MDWYKTKTWAIDHARGSKLYGRGRSFRLRNQDSCVFAQSIACSTVVESEITLIEDVATLDAPYSPRWPRLMKELYRATVEDEE
jgi:hypothetical protein